MARAAPALSSAALFILTPPAIRLGRCLSQIPAPHVRDTRSPVQPRDGLMDTTQWYTHFAGAGVDIWTAETKVKHGSALLGNRAHFSTCTYSVVSVGLETGLETFSAVIKDVRLHNNHGGSYKRLQTSTQLSFCCYTGFHCGCHIKIYSKCLLEYSSQVYDRHVSNKSFFILCSHSSPLSASSFPL